MIKNFLNEISGISLIDIGSSGKLDEKYSSLVPHINLIGFDPNQEECERMSKAPNRYKSMLYLPYAISGKSGVETLYKTESIYCYSLLKPNTEWLNRFSFRDLFRTTGSEDIATRVLSEIAEVASLDVDIIKTDTQGLELPILRTAGQALNQAFLVETETGFVQNYVGETTYSQIDEFMRSQHFLLFDLNTSHRISRNNIFKNIKSGAEQLMWCEAVWLKDYVALERANGLDELNFSRDKVLKALILVALQGCVDYGYEIAKLAFDAGRLNMSELTELEKRQNWMLTDVSPLKRSTIESKVLRRVFRLLPERVVRAIGEHAMMSLKKRKIGN